MPIKNKEVNRDYQKTWAKEKRAKNRAIVQQYKVDHGCADCGWNEHHAGLEFDHINGTKEYNVANLMSHEKRLWEEIAKCEVVCSRCHSIRTWDRLKLE